MNGKLLKVVEYNLEFGKQARMVNVFGVFRYLPNNNLYIIYRDVLQDYNYVSYGSSHVKGDTVLSMNCNKEQDEEIIKKYIYKVTNKEELSDFEIINLSKITGVEIISSNNLEIKQSVLENLIKLTIPQEKHKEKPDTIQETSKKRSPVKILLVFLILILFFGCGFYFYSSLNNSDTKIDKNIVCTINYPHDEIASVTVFEEETFYFGNDDLLQNLKKNTKYKFSNEEEYLNFINKGLYYKYMPETSDDNGGWSSDDDKLEFKMIEKTSITESYSGATKYEDVLAEAKSDGYTCSENVEK